MIDIPKASINTAGAYIRFQGLYLFALGIDLHQGRIPVFRIGGHREGDEKGWECAAREAREEINQDISFLKPPTTYLLPDGGFPDAALEKIKWQYEAEQEYIPWLIVAYPREGQILLSLMYQAKIERSPNPSSEIKGLIMLDPENIHRICQEPVTLGQYRNEGGRVLINHEFDTSLILEPFTQLRLLSRMLLVESGNKK